MSSTHIDHTMILDTGRSDAVWTVAFHPDGTHFWSGSGDGLRRWRVSDGQEMSRQPGMNLNVVSVSRDQKWIVCGTQRGASVWDADQAEPVVTVERGMVVAAVDVSPDACRFATGTGEVNVWDIQTGQRLLTLEHDNDVRGVLFSPDGRRLATACEHDHARVFDSHNGDAILTIETTIPSFYPITPLAWSNDGERIFATSVDNKIRSFDAATGSQLAESPTLNGVESIALANNGRFIATFASRSVSFLDALTLTFIGPAIEDSEDVRSIALSPRNTHLATGQCKGKIVVRNLDGILPDSYLPIHEQASTSEDNPPDSDSEEIGIESETSSEDGGDDLLETEIPPNTSKPLFDYDEPPSPAFSTHPNEDKASPAHISHSLDILPVLSPEVIRSEGSPDVDMSSEDVSARKGWRQMFKRNIKDSTSARGRPRRPAFWSRSQPPTNIDTQFPVMAEGRRQRRTVTKYPHKKPPAKAAVPAEPENDATRDEQEPAGSKEAPSAQPLYQLLPKALTITREPGSGKATVSLTLPAWMLCFRSGAEDGMH